jgi:regulator of protease activity HflC (stomatin/prohibitin superfamily)
MKGPGNPCPDVVLKVKTIDMRTTWTGTLILACIATLTSCTIVRQGEVGIKRRLGRLQPGIQQPGPVGFNPFTTRVLKMSTQKENVEVSLDLPSKEGLTIRSQISILYHIKPDAAPRILETVGTGYENTLILSVFRSAAADVTSRFMAKDMHTGERAVIEKQIKDLMERQLQARGFDIEAVLLKSIQLPQGLSQAIQQKLEAEQEAQRMEFVLDRERREADRKKIEAEGLREAQKIISEGLNEFFIKWKSLEVFKQLATSGNTKVVITDGKTPLLIDTDAKPGGK